MVAQAACPPERACWLRAWDRAVAERLIPFRSADRTSWIVKQYTVAVVGAGWSDLVCDCPAGRNGRVCKHCAVVAKARAIGVSPLRKPVAPAVATLPVDLPPSLATVRAALR